MLIGSFEYDGDDVFFAVASSGGRVGCRYLHLRGRHFGTYRQVARLSQRRDRVARARRRDTRQP